VIFMNKMILTGAGVIGASIGIKEQINASKEFSDAKTTPKFLALNAGTEALKYVGYAAGATKLIESAVTGKAPNLAAMGFGAGLGAIEGYLAQQSAQAFDKQADNSIGAYAQNMLRGSISGAFLGLGASGVASDLVFRK
jgi:hypothetical protein